MNKKINTKKIGIALFLSILCFSFLLQQNYKLNYDNQDDKINRRTIKLPSISDTNRYEWNTIWGGFNYDEGYGIAVDGLGNIFITGRTSSFGAGDWDVFLLKFDPKGNLLWYKTWGNPGYDGGRGIALDSNGNVLITGSSNGDLILLKYDSSGNLLWDKTWGGSDNYYGNGITVDSSGNVFITGYAYNYGAGTDRDIILLKYDKNGNQLWNETWGGSSSDYGYGIAVDDSGNIFITGITFSFRAGTDGDIILLKYDTNGNQLWKETWGGSSSDYGYGIAVDDSGNIFITGSSDGDVILLNYDPNGNQFWNNTWIDSYGDKGYGIAIDGLGNIFITGEIGGYEYGLDDAFLLKFDSNGNLLWKKTWGGSDYDWGWGIAVDGSGNVFITGQTHSYGEGGYDTFILKYGVDTDNDGLSDKDEINLYSTNPNNSDTDFDGLSDGMEIELGTNPKDADTDGDRFTDGEEVNSGTDPLNFFDNWLLRGVLIIVIVSVSITGLVLGYREIKKKIKKKNAQKIKIMTEKGDLLNIQPIIKESINSYQKNLLKTEKTRKYMTNSMRSGIMKLQITELVEKAERLKREGEFIGALENLSLAGKLVDKITDKSINEQLTRNILNLLDSIYIETIEKKIEEALKLREMKKFEESISLFNDTFSDVDKIRDKTLKDKNLSILKDYVITTRIIKTKDFIFNLSQNSERLEVSDIVEKSGMREAYILSAILDMIKNREISAEYIKSTKEVVFQKQVNIEEIDKLIKSFEDWEKEGKGKKW
ncbi:MAG: SBBP repeat-containing protein [Promethearchaeota archaeon]